MKNSNENIKSIEELKKIIFSKDFLNKLLTLEKIEDVKKLFSDKEIEITDDELNLIGEYLKKYINSKNENNNLTEKDLESVSGGVNIVVKYIGRVISFPFSIGGFIVGSIPSALVRGMWDGARDTWYNS